MRKSIITIPLKRYRKFGYQKFKEKITWIVTVKRWYYSHVREICINRKERYPNECDVRNYWTILKGKLEHYKESFKIQDIGLYFTV